MDKLADYIAAGNRLRIELGLKGYFARTVNNTVIDMLRNRYGRPDKEGRIKNPRPLKVEMERAALELAVGEAGPSIEELEVLVKEWAEVIDNEAGDEVGIVFELQALLLDKDKVAKRLGIKLSVVEKRLKKAWQIVARHRLDS